MAIDFNQPSAEPSLRTRTLRKAGAILALGILIALLQPLRIAPVSGAGLVTGWAGPWLVFSLIAFVILWLRYRRSSPGYATVATAVIFSLGLNTCVHNAANERQRASESAAKVQPFYEAFARGEFPTDEEIKAANLGRDEPRLLAQAAVRRELGQLSAAYEAAWYELDLTYMLLPDQLVSKAARAESRARLEDSATLHNTFAIQFNAAFDDGMKRLSDAFDVRPSTSTDKPNRLEKRMAPARDHYLDIADVRRTQQDVVLDIIKLLDARPSGFRLNKGEPGALYFSDAALGERYQLLNQRLIELHDRLVTLENSLTVWQSKLADEVDEVIRQEKEGV